MIAKLTGTIADKTDKFLVIDTQGVGYKVYCTTDLLSNSGDTGSEVSVWTYLAVRENALDLFGFETKDELDLFELLIGISGIGPRNALGVLAVAPVETIKAAISAGDSSYMTKVSGIGKKTAEKIVLELKDKLGDLSDVVLSANSQDDKDVIEALMALGYSSHEAREALKKISADTVGLDAKIKEALKNLS